MSYRETLEFELQQFQIDLDATQKAGLVTYCEDLSRWNKKINLTGLTGAPLVRRLVVEPVWIAQRLRMNGVLLDIGSGNGSPAIPLHVVAHFQNCQLVEARSRRAAFLRHLSGRLNLREVVVHRAKFEDVLMEIQAPEWITLQAVVLTPELMNLIRRISTRATTTAWITSANVSADVEPAEIVSVPNTGTQVLLFKSGCDNPT